MKLPIENPIIKGKISAVVDDYNVPYLLFVLATPVYVVGAATITLWIMGKI